MEKSNVFRVGHAAVKLCDDAAEEWHRTPVKPEIQLGVVKIADGNLRFPPVSYRPGIR